MRGKRTVLDVAVLDLLQHLGPDGCVHLLVLVDELGLQLDDLRDPAAWITGIGVLRRSPAGWASG